MFDYVVSENGVDTVVTVQKRADKPEGSVTVASFLKGLEKDEDLGGIIPDATVFDAAPKNGKKSKKTPPGRDR